MRNAGYGVHWIGRRNGFLVSAASFVFLFLIIVGPLDWSSRYVSWRNLSKGELVESASWYIEQRAPGNKACLYAVGCNDGRAKLKLIKSIQEWDIDAARQIAWQRKFGGFCKGRTANFALELAPNKVSGTGVGPDTKKAVWSFYNDRFVPTRSRASSSAFSEGEVEACTAEYAIAGK